MRRLFPLLVLALVLSSCGGDSDDAFIELPEISVTTTSTTTAPVTTTTSAPATNGATLREALEELGTRGAHRATVEGVDVDLETTLETLHGAMRGSDQFLHVCVWM